MGTQVSKTSHKWFQRLMELYSTKDDEQRKARLVSLGIILVSLLALWWYFS